MGQIYIFSLIGFMRNLQEILMGNEHYSTLSQRTVSKHKPNTTIGYVFRHISIFTLSDALGDLIY